MRKFEIVIPDGWILKALGWACGAAVLAAGVPFWWVKWNSWAEVERARAKMEAREIMAGGCGAITTSENDATQAGR